MPSDRALEDLIETLRPRFESLKAGAEEARPDVKVGCALGLFVPALGLFLAFILPVWWPIRIAGLVAAVIAAPIGWPRLMRFAKKAGALKAPFEAQVLRPYVDLLMPGAVLSRGSVPMADWNRSRLFASGIAGSNPSVRLTGTIAGLPATLDETWWAIKAMYWSFDGWIVHFELPFAVAGHLRIRLRRTEKPVITDGFETLPEPTARLGDAYVVDVGPLDGGPAPGVDPARLLTEDVLEWSRVDPDVQVAVAGRELWVALGSTEDVLPEQVVNFELEALRHGARRFAIAEAIARAILAAGAARP